MIRPNPNQPRTHFDDDAIDALSASIGEVGVLQPVLVRPVTGGYELVAGERRWRAAQQAGLESIPALVREVEDDTSLEQALVENVQREDLSAIEEGLAFQQLVDRFGMTYDQVAQRVGKSKSAVANTIRLLQLPPAVQDMITEGELSAGHGRAILGLTAPGTQEVMARRVVSSGWSVRATEDHVRREAQRETGDRPARRPAEPKAAALLELEHLLSDHLDTRVEVTVRSGHRGRIVIDFADLADLERVFRVITEGRSGS